MNETGTRVLPGEVFMAAALMAGVLFPGCGREGPTPAAPNKTVPVLAFTYQGRSLSDWRSLPKDAPAEERAAAAFGIAALEPDPANGIAAIVALLHDPEPSVRIAAVIASERMALPSAEAAALIARFLGAPQKALRRQARLALSAMGEAGLAALSSSLEDEGLLVRWGALVALARMAESAAVMQERVRALVEQDPEASVRRQALFTLARLGAEGIASTLPYLRRDELELRSEAAAALAQVGAPAVPALAALLTDEDEVAAALAAGILADVGQAAEPALEELLRALERVGIVRSNAAAALIAIGPSAIPGLRRLMDGADPELTATVRYALERIEER